MLAITSGGEIVYHGCLFIFQVQKYNFFAKYARIRRIMVSLGGFGDDYDRKNLYM
jgi:hypothetical protein